MDDMEDKPFEQANSSFANEVELNVMNEITLQVVGQMSNISHLSSNSLKPVTIAINNLARKIAFTTMHITRQSNRCIASSYDAYHALKLEKISTSFSVTPSKLVPLKQTKQSSNDVQLFYPEDIEVELHEIVSKEPSKVPHEPSLTEHWLSIYSVQPATPENPSPAYTHAQKKYLRDKVYGKSSKNNPYQINKDGTRCYDPNGSYKSNSVRGSLNGIALGFNGDRMPAKVIEIRPHFVGTEHQVYFKTLTEACVGNDENARNNALVTIKNDKALDPLMPHLMQFIAEGIRLNIIYQNLAVLIYLVRIVRSLVDNPNVNLDPYLFRIIPALLSVVLCGNICLNPITDNHFALRKFAGKVVHGICDRQHTARNELVTRLSNVLMNNIKQIIMSVSDDDTNPSVTPMITSSSAGVTDKNVNQVSNTTRSQDYTMRLNTLCGSVLCLSELTNEAIIQCLVPKIGPICHFLSYIINSKGPTLPGAEDKAICFLKDLLASEKILRSLYEYRVSKDYDLSYEVCTREYGILMGGKFHEFFTKTPPIRSGHLTVLPQQQHVINQPVNISGSQL